MSKRESKFLKKQKLALSVIEELRLVGDNVEIGDNVKNDH